MIDNLIKLNYNHKWKAKVFKEGRCENCGKPREDLSNTRCNECRLKHTNYVKQKYNKERSILIRHCSICKAPGYNRLTHPFHTKD